jgi:thiol-disulfide isomerase/thioredoxin
MTLIVFAGICCPAFDKKPSELALHDMAGRKVRLSDYRGKVVVVNFWATWCEPCRDEMPLLVEAERTWAAKGVVFLAVSLDDHKTEKNIGRFLDSYGVRFPVWVGATSDDLDRLRMGAGVPDTAFLDESGVVVARVLGQIRREELMERLAWLTGDRKAAAPAAIVHHM